MYNTNWFTYGYNRLQNVCINYLKESRCDLKCMRMIFIVLKDEESMNNTTQLEIKKLEVKC